MLTKHISTAREHTKYNLLGTEKQQLSEKKLASRITYYLMVQNVSCIMKELQTLLTPY